MYTLSQDIVGTRKNVLNPQLSQIKYRFHFGSIISVSPESMFSQLRDHLHFTSSSIISVTKVASPWSSAISRRSSLFTFI